MFDRQFGFRSLAIVGVVLAGWTASAVAVPRLAPHGRYVLDRAALETRMLGVTTATYGATLPDDLRKVVVAKAACSWADVEFFNAPADGVLVRLREQVQFFDHPEVEDRFEGTWTSTGEWSIGMTRKGAKPDDAKATLTATLDSREEALEVALGEGRTLRFKREAPAGTATPASLAATYVLDAAATRAMLLENIPPDAETTVRGKVDADLATLAIELTLAADQTATLSGRLPLLRKDEEGKSIALTWTAQENRLTLAREGSKPFHAIVGGDSMRMYPGDGLRYVLKKK